MTHPDIGAIVSHYRIVRRLGSGGMGAVFLAQDLTLDRPVAVKFLAAADDPHARRRLLREAKAVAALDHEGIAAVYEVGEDPSGVDFIVMQYVEGETLASRLQRGPLSPAEALAVAGRIAEALIAAHRRGIVHRDLKPQNIMVTPAGVPKLLDFGLAHRITTASDEGVETATHSATTRVVAGTPAYMSPEQARNQEVDGRSDVFALGCVLYECLTGRRAFEGASAAEVIGQVQLLDPPPPSARVSGLGPAHDALCARLLKKAAADRFQSAEEALGAIHALTDTEKIASSHSGTRAARVADAGWRLVWARQPVLLVVAASVTLALVASAWWYSRGVSLPVAPPDARGHYARGVMALRDGTYAGARDQFQEALRLFPDYVEALSGLTLASKELDDTEGATQAMMRVNRLVPDRTRLPADDRLRIESALAFVDRSYDDAVAAYAALAARHPDDAGAWLDLAMACDAAGRRVDARTHLDHALKIDTQLAAAHLRLGAFLVQEGRRDQAFAALDEAVRLYRVDNNVEGEAEALLRKGIALNNAGDLADARRTLDDVVRLAGTRYLSQRVRARFELARVAVREGTTDDLQAETEAAVAEAVDARLFSLAANGRVDLGTVYLFAGQFDRAQSELEKAIEAARRYGAAQTEMRAQLQLASALDTRGGEPARVLALAQAPLEFFTTGKQWRRAADAKTIIARAHEQLGQFTKALALTREVLAYADQVGDQALASDALQNQAFLSANLGHLPDMLASLTRAESIYRARGLEAALPLTLLSKAEALIALGRGAEAGPVLAEVEAGIAAGRDTDARRPRRVAWLRAYWAVTEGRLAEVPRLAAAAEVPAGASPDTIALGAHLLTEYARSQLGRPGAPASTVIRWLDEMAPGRTRRDMRVWTVRILLARREPDRAKRVLEDGWADPATLDNPELRWRMAALGELSGATIPQRSASSLLQSLRTMWGAADLDTYLRRTDLKGLRATVPGDLGGSS